MEVVLSCVFDCGTSFDLEDMFGHLSVVSFLCSICSALFKENSRFYIICSSCF